MFRLLPPLRAPVKQSSSICLIEFHILPKNISDEQQLRKTRLAKHITTYRIYHKTSYLSLPPPPPTPTRLHSALSIMSNFIHENFSALFSIRLHSHCVHASVYHAVVDESKQRKNSLARKTHITIAAKGFDDKTNCIEARLHF